MASRANSDDSANSSVDDESVGEEGDDDEGDNEDGDDEDGDAEDEGADVCADADRFRISSPFPVLAACSMHRPHLQ